MKDTTVATTAVLIEQKKLETASRILRAVERSRVAPDAVPQNPAAAASTEQTQTNATAGPSSLKADRPNIETPRQGVDARSALRSLSERREPGFAPREAAKEPEAAAKTEPGGAKPAEPNAKSAKKVTEMPQPAKPVENERKGVKTGGEEPKPAGAGDGKFKSADDRSRPAGVRPGDPAFEAPILGMGPNPRASFWANLPLVVKIGCAVLLVGLAAGFLFKFSGGSGAVRTADPKPAVTSGPVLTPMSGIGGWTPSWGDPAKMKGRSISLFRPSLQHADYRIEFEAQIESKAFGWVFRARDPQNYYAYKVEIVKPGPQPLVALARVMMVAGVESQKHYTPIESPVRPDTVFQVRMDCIGSEFTTRINDQLVEVWQDSRHLLGGAGLFSDPGERAQVRKVQVFEAR